jgi:putative transposase
MSQKVKITGARVHGSPVYLGDVTQPDSTVAPVWSADPARVLGWLCDGFRFRFNQRRSTRCRYLMCVDRSGNQVVVTDPSGEPVLVAIGNTVTDISDAEARRRHSFLAAMPGYVLEATLKTENTDWFSAVKRRRTNAANGRNPERCRVSAAVTGISGLCAGSTVAATRCSPAPVAGRAR